MLIEGRDMRNLSGRFRMMTNSRMGIPGIIQELEALKDRCRLQGWRRNKRERAANPRPLGLTSAIRP